MYGILPEILHSTLRHASRFKMYFQFGVRLSQAMLHAS